GEGTSNIQPRRIARPSTARTADMVSTSVPSIRTTLLSTSAQANGSAEHGRADLRRTAADVRSRELAHGKEVLRGTRLPAILVWQFRRLLPTLDFTGTSHNICCNLLRPDFASVRICFH